MDCNRVHFSTVSLTCPCTVTISETMVSRTMIDRMKPVKNIQEKRFRNLQLTTKSYKAMQIPEELFILIAAHAFTLRN